MHEELESRLVDAGRVGADAHAVDAALMRMVDASVPAVRPRRLRRVPWAIALGSALAIWAPVAVVAATQWAPWNFVTDPEIVLERTWTDIDGNPLGACVTRIATNELPEDAQAVAVGYFDELDIDALAPNAESVASGLNAHGRLDEIGRFVAGAEPGDFDVRFFGPPLVADATTDARIMQDGLMEAATRGMTETVFAAHPELGDVGIDSIGETQCIAP